MNNLLAEYNQPQERKKEHQQQNILSSYNLPEERNNTGIIILSAPSAANGAGHQAILIGSEYAGWTYISKDGYIGANPLNSPSKYVKEKFATYADFLKSDHNKVITYTHLDERYYNSYDIQLIKSQGAEIKKNISVRYTGATFISIEPNLVQSAIEIAEESAKSDYKLLNGQNCSHVVTDVLRAIGKNDGENSLGEVIGGFLISPLGGFLIYSTGLAPRIKQNKIRQRNTIKW